MDKIQYELSLWEYQLIDDVYKEQYILNIGTSSSNEKNQAFNLQLTENINGSVSLSFSIYQKYFDQDVNDFVENPFLGLLVNERLLKLKLINSFYDVNIEHEDSDVDTENEWYDLIIKNIEENSSNNIFTYTAVGAQINELSKNGFSLEFNSELENNSGTIIELAEKALEETDWSVDIDNSDTIRQYTQEPLKTMQVKPGKTITAVNALNNTETITLEENDIILGFYSCINNQEPDLQFLYKENGIYTTEENVIINSKNYIISNNNYTNFIYTDNVYESQGKKLISKQKSIFDPVLDRTVLLYTNSNNDNIRGYTETEYITPTVIQNLITNNKNFITTDGWYFNTNVSILPKYNTSTNKTFLQIKSSVAQTFFYNNGIEVTRSYINGFSIGEKYRIRINSNTTPNIFPNICKYSLENGVYSLITNYFSFGTSWIKEADTDYYYLDGSCIKSTSYASLITEKIGVLFKQNNTNALNIYDIQLFKKETDANGSVLNPDSIWTSTIKTLYNYYKYDSTISALDDIVYLYKGEEQQSYSPVFTEDYEKIRSIEISESNRFNILQSLSEIFECWMKIDVKHNYKGDILSKKISFKEFIGEENYAGFKYGLNLKSITRNLISNQIVTKIVVKNNANSFAENGFCSIARADENPTKENFLLNFDYYINQGFLNRNQIINDLYLTNGNFLGYYAHLKENNLLRDKYIDEQTALATEYTNINAVLQAFEIAKEEANVQLNTLKNELKLYNGLINYKNYTGNDDKVIEYIQAITATEQNIENFDELVESSSSNLAIVQSKQEELEDSLNTILENNSLLHSAFYDKYGKFIQEGSWISENYLDDNLYYLDADSTLRTSAMPQVNYIINVTDISAIDDYKNYSFKCGNKTYVEDTEFFGWSYIDGVKTPYKEEVIISQIVRVLDNPINNKITVQNYKTQFEDLFQRITATTQAVQYHSGEYNKVSSIIDEDGTIKSNTLQNSFLNNSFVLENSNDQSIVWNDSGITAIDKTDLSKMLRLVGGGLFLSNDGGQTWSAGVTGGGINATYITAGQIDTQKINIMDGINTSFRWDSTGINAYKHDDNGTNYNKFIRYDQFGVYGISGEDSDIFKPTTTQEIREKAQFAFLWDGFYIKSSNNDGYISISSTDDIQVFDATSERIKIGKLNDYYGLRISTDSVTVMETTSSGELYLRDKMYFGPIPDDSNIIIGSIGEAINGVTKVFQVKDSDNTNAIEMYDDGTFVANKVNIKGAIEATSGKIGNLTIAEIESNNTYLEVTSENGNIFKDSEGIVTPQTIKLTAKTYGFTPSSYVWKGSSDFENWITLSNSDSTYSLVYDASSFSDTGLYYIQVTATNNDNEIFTDTLTFTYIKDGDSPELELYYINTNIEALLKYSGGYNGDFSSATESEVTLYELNSDFIEIAFADKEGNIQEFENYNLELFIKNYNLTESESSTDLINFYIDFYTLLEEQNQEPASGSFVYKNSITNKAYIYVDRILKFSAENITTSDDGITKADVSFYHKIRQILLEEDSNLLINIVYNNQKYIKVLDVRYGTTKEMLNFSINASSLNAAFTSSGLIFNENGLTIDRGSFSIIDNNGEVIGFDKEGNAVFNGTGIFKGEITATSGTFNGTINATDGFFSGELKGANGTFVGELKGATGNFSGNIYASGGTIGGLQISESGIQGINAEKEIVFSLSSVDGSIVANKILLGAEATISDKIEFISIETDEDGTILDTKTAFLYNPQSHGGEFIKSGELSIRNDGTASFGDIYINGAESSIVSNAWQLYPELAVFNNAQVKGTLSSVVFDTQTITGGGGLFVFKDSYKIISFKKMENTELSYIVGFDSGTISSQNNSLKNGDYISINGENVDTLIATILSIEKESETIKIQVMSEPSNSLSNYNMIVLLGSFTQENNDNSTIFNAKDWLIGINSTSSIGGYNLQPNAISLNSLTLENGALAYTPEIILGKIIDPITNEETSGLYASSAYLHGTLTTKYNDNIDEKYAGINTLSGASFNKSSDKGMTDTSPIVFWAGSLGDSNEEIQNAPFQVTSSGYLYASSGYFTGSLITNSTIEAASIKTAKITGSGTSPALVLEGADISFTTSISTDDIDTTTFTETLKIDGSGLVFLQPPSDNILFQIQDTNNQTIFNIKGNGFIETPQITSGSLILSNSTIVGDSTSINLLDSFSVTNSNVEVIKGNSKEISLQASFINVSGSFIINGDNGINELYITAKDGGYDFEIRE